MALLNLFKSNQNDPYAQPIDRKKVFLFGGLAVAVLIGLGLFVFTLFSGNARGDFMTLLARQQFLTTTVEDSQKRVRSSDLAQVNSDAALLFKTHTVALQGQLQSRFGTDRVSNEAKERETDSVMLKKLEDAALLDKFDVTYRNALREKISRLLLLAPDIRDRTGGREFREVMDAYIADLQAVDDRLTDLSL